MHRNRSVSPDLLQQGYQTHGTADCIQPVCSSYAALILIFLYENMDRPVFNHLLYFHLKFVLPTGRKVKILFFFASFDLYNSTLILP